MYLTGGNLFHYLSARGFASNDQIVGSDFRVTMLSRRNQAYRVHFANRPGYVVKQVKEWRPINVRTFEAEAHWYWLARNESKFAPLAPFLGSCRGYDAENQILILDHPIGCEDLERHHRRLGAFPEEIAEKLGDTLGAFHTALPDETRAELSTGFMPVLPALFSWHKSQPEENDKESKGVQELLRIVQEQPAFAEAFDRIAAGWRRETLINGDMKLAHCILNEGKLYFIDWEMATLGDPCWDTGAIFQEYLFTWIRGISPASGSPTEDMLRNARHQLSDVQPPIRAFWHAYVHRIGVAESAAAELLRRTVDYTAAWLIQFAYQWLRNEEQIDARAVRMAQLSLNLLRSPEQAIHQLLGL